MKNEKQEKNQEIKHTKIIDTNVEQELAEKEIALK